MATTDEDKAERKPTERVVLKRETVLVLPPGVDLAQLFAPDTKALKKMGIGPPVEAWIEVARATAPTKATAIEAHAGKAGTPDALQGVFRAPTVTSWKDGVVYEAPPMPLVERSVIE